MARPKAAPEFIWGDIIKVPPKALCPDGLHSKYDAIYGIVVSSRRLWRNDIGLHHLFPRRGKVRESERVGQYLVALISRRDDYPALEFQVETNGPFKGWFVAAGLFVNVLESQLDEIPASERYRGSLKGSDRRRLDIHLRRLLEYDPDEERNDGGDNEESQAALIMLKRFLKGVRRYVFGASRRQPAAQTWPAAGD